MSTLCFSSESVRFYLSTAHHDYLKEIIWYFSVKLTNASWWKQHTTIPAISMCLMFQISKNPNPEADIYEGLNQCVIKPTNCQLSTIFFWLKFWYSSTSITNLLADRQVQAVFEVVLQLSWDPAASIPCIVAEPAYTRISVYRVQCWTTFTQRAWYTLN